MYRAHLHLYPHSLSHPKSSTVPGAFPTTVNGDHSKDFARTIQLSIEKPTQPIGRSSRNEAKGLFAAKNNAFFDSPVMSRAHAEVRMILEPTRKIVIKDTNSMHGTYVNGLQLHHQETAELRDGTELTFGADVSRGDELYPAKTFRCVVGWESVQSPQENKQPEKPLSGYGVRGEDLLMSENDNDDFDEDYEDEHDDEEAAEDSYHSEEEDDRLSTSSGRSSPASSPAPMSPGVGPSSRFASDNDIPESHERTTLPNMVNFNNWSKKKEHEVIMLDKEDSQSKPETIRPRMPSIPSLVNRGETEMTPRKPVVVETISEGSEVEIVCRPPIFTPQKPKDTRSGEAAQPICVDDIESDEEDEEELSDNIDYLEDDGEEEISEAEDSNHADEAHGSEVADDDIVDEPMDDDSYEKEEQARKEAAKAQAPETPKTVGPKVTAPSQPSQSPPTLLSSKLSDHFWDTRESYPPNIPTTNCSSVPASANPVKHIRFPPAPAPPMPPMPQGAIQQPQKSYMEAKKEFFNARAENYASINGRNIFSNWHEDRPTARQWPEWVPSPNNLPPIPNAPVSLPEIDQMKYPAKGKPNMLDQLMKDPVGELVKANSSRLNALLDQMDKWDGNQEDEDAEFDEDIDEMEAHANADVSESQPPKLVSTASVGESQGSSYSKLSIDDMMNPPQRAPTPLQTEPAVFFVSPPPSDDAGSDMDIESRPITSEPESDAPKLVPSTSTSLKRKHSRISHVEVSAPQDLAREEYEDYSIESEEDQTEKPLAPARRIKKLKNGRHERGSTGIGKFAAGVAAGLVFGAVGMFGALVATA